MLHCVYTHNTTFFIRLKKPKTILTWSKRKKSLKKPFPLLLTFCFVRSKQPTKCCNILIGVLLALAHRRCQFDKKNYYRFLPTWQIALTGQMVISSFGAYLPARLLGHSPLRRLLMSSIVAANSLVVKMKKKWIEREQRQLKLKKTNRKKWKHTKKKN